MKKIGETYTIRGILPVNTPNVQIRLFDGRFDTGFRIESIEVCSSLPIISVEFQVIVSTDSLTDAITFDWSENTQIAWACWNAADNNLTSSPSWVDPDNLVVEDLFISNRGGTDDTFVNYLIRMQKYDFSDWRGALAMVRNRSQGASND